MTVAARPRHVYNDSIVPAEAYEWYPHYVTFLPKAHIDSVLHYAGTDIVPVKFELYETEVIPTPQLDSIVSLIKSVNTDERVKLAYVWVGGSASPDGDYKRNLQLAESRGLALRDYLAKHANLNSEEIRFDNLGEDWFTITALLYENETFKYRDPLLDIVESEPDPDRREMKMKRIDGGVPWSWFKTEILPDFRNARMVIVCSAEDIQLYPIEKVDPAKKREANPDTIPDIELKPIELPEQPVDTVPEPEPEPVKTWFVAAKTNLLFLAGTIANIGAEIQFAEKWSVDLPLYYSPYNLSSTRKIRVLATQPEVRYWLGEDAGKGHFVGVHGHLAGFNVAINDHGRYQDPERPLWGFGLGYGYAVNFGARQNWGLEFNLGLGFANYEYDKFINAENGQKIDFGKDWYYGLTRAGITLTYKWWIPRKSKAVKEIIE